MIIYEMLKYMKHSIVLATCNMFNNPEADNKVQEELQERLASSEHINSRSHDIYHDCSTAFGYNPVTRPEFTTRVSVK